MEVHKDLIVWQRSIRFVTKIYDTTKCFPKEELYGITNQLRRAAVSVPSNIAEGAARQSNKDYIRLLYFSLSSLMEVDTQLLISYNLEYLGKEKFEYLKKELTEIAKMLSGLINFRKSKKTP